MELDYKQTTIHQRIGNEEQETEIFLPEYDEDEETVEIGIYGQRHLRFIREYKPGLYSSLVLSGKLVEHLADVDEQAETLLFRLVNDMAAKEGVTAQLKESNQMAWVQRMNNIRNRVMEIVNAEIIYA